MAYEVRTEAFQGPFDLLLHLIVRDEVDLYEVSLSSIVDAYLGELTRMEDDVELEVATEFLMIAATLIELKSRRLLPGDADVDLDDELALWEERDLLLARLLECKTFKDASRALEKLATAAGRSFPRLVGLDEQFLDLVPDPLEHVTPADVAAAFARAVAPKPQVRLDLHHVTPIRFTVAEVVHDLVTDLPERGSVTLRELTASFADRLDVVVHFLAVLELYKQGLVELGQFERFGDITVEWIAGARADADSVTADVYEG